MPYFKRKQLRLPHYDYSAPGCYFITICTKDRKCILSRISVGVDVPGDPEISLSEYGKNAEKTLLEIEQFYSWLKIDNYVIMPNHVHLLVRITEEGSPGTSTPTAAKIPAMVSTWKRKMGKEIGSNVWQRGYYEHVIRDENDFRGIWEYIEVNPAKWTQDRYYTDL